MAPCVAVTQIYFDEWRFNHKESHQTLLNAALVSNRCPISTKNYFSNQMR